MKCMCSEKRKQIAVKIPDGIGDGREVAHIDECILPVIRHLWGKGISTLNSCCGHGEANPSIALEPETSFSDARKAEIAIREVDSRKFDLYSWRLEKVN